MGCPVAFSSANWVSKRSPVAPSAKYRVKLPTWAMKKPATSSFDRFGNAWLAGLNTKLPFVGVTTNEPPIVSPVKAYRPSRSVTSVPLSEPVSVIVTPGTPVSLRSRT